MANLVFAYNLLHSARLLELKRRQNERRITRHFSKILTLPDEEFRANFRINNTLFEIVYTELKPYLPVPKRKSDILPKFKILVALSFYASGSYQRLVGGTKGLTMSQQSVSRCVKQVTAALNYTNVFNKYIIFSQRRCERDAIKRRFYEKFGIPSVVGCIDGTHVAIIRPKRNEERFFNRKHIHSRNVMIICDADLNILCVDASFGGASHDSFIWNQQPIKEHLKQLNGLGENIYLLGDSGYAQRVYMMTPIVDAPEGSPEKHYAKIQCSARNTVERTIGILKNRWRCLLSHRVLHYDADTAAKIIYACCVLHNMCKSSSFPSEELPGRKVYDIKKKTTLNLYSTPPH